MAQEDAISRLARQIDAARQAERYLVDPAEVEEMRRRGACELHRVCAQFVALVNGRLAQSKLELSPSEFAPEAFRQPGANLFQIGSQGRIVQITFQAPAQLVSTDKFPVPHVLDGEVRAYNQEMLQRFDVKSQSLFFCVEHGAAGWRFYDWRTLHTGAVDCDFLVNLLEPLF